MSMKIVIEKEFDNILLNRKQIHFRIIHQKQATPTRAEIRKKIAAQFNADLEKVIISQLIPKYGQAFTVGYAKIYETLENLQKIEPKYAIKRNKIKEEKPESE